VSYSWIAIIKRSLRKLDGWKNGRLEDWSRIQGCQPLKPGSAEDQRLERPIVWATGTACRRAPITQITLLQIDEYGFIVTLSTGLSHREKRLKSPPQAMKINLTLC
jgi:hypothetical protein